MLLSVVLSRFSQRKKTTSLVLQSWPSILSRRKRLPRLPMLQNPRRRFLALRRSLSSRKRPHLRISDSQKSLWSVEIPCRKSRVLSKVKGTDPDGRTIREDVEKYNPEPASAGAPVIADPSADYVDMPLSNMRRTIAAHLA